VRFVTLALVLLSVVACSGADIESPTSTMTSQADQTKADQAATEEPDVTAIRITIGDRTINAQLADNPTAHDLAGQLPLTLTFRDFNRLEKIAVLPRPLTTKGVPEGDDPDVADIGYYAPTNNLVLYYGEVGYWNGIIRIGRFNRDNVDFIRGQPDGLQTSIERG
jgi:hypothetical protein